MPELPEVQSTVDYLASRIKRRSITSCSISWARSVATHTPRLFSSLIVGQKVSNVTRRGKYIVINLESGTLLIHLRMSGVVDVVSSNIQADPYDRVCIKLDNNKEIRFNDVRKFGKIYFFKDPDIYLSRLGVEPLSESFTKELLKEILKNKRGAIKPFLLNQKFIVGIGNIYADESLWASKIHPKRMASSLKDDEISKLHQSIIKILNQAIRLNGTDNGDYVVEGGSYKPKAYGKDGSACSRCKNEIVKIVLAQRGTHFCKSCQK